GSDAVSRLENFIRNNNFTGWKANVSSGLTDRNDDRTTNADVSFGSGFANGRGHFLVSGEYGRVGGIDMLDPSDREWFKSVDMLTFASTVTPQRVVRANVNTRTVAQG